LFASDAAGTCGCRIAASTLPALVRPRWKQDEPYDRGPSKAAPHGPTVTDFDPEKPRGFAGPIDGPLSSRRTTKTKTKKKKKKNKPPDPPPPAHPPFNLLPHLRQISRIPTPSSKLLIPLPKEESGLHQSPDSSRSSRRAKKCPPSATPRRGGPGAPSSAPALFSAARPTLLQSSTVGQAQQKSLSPTMWLKTARPCHAALAHGPRTSCSPSSGSRSRSGHRTGRWRVRLLRHAGVARLCARGPKLRVFWSPLNQHRTPRRSRDGIREAADAT